MMLLLVSFQMQAPPLICTNYADSKPARTRGADAAGHAPLAVSAVLQYAIGPTHRDVPGVSVFVTSKPGFSAARSAGTLSAE